MGRQADAPFAGGVEDVTDAVKVVRERVVACAHDAQLAVEGADAGAQLTLDLAEYRRSPDRPPSPYQWCAHVQDTEVGRERLEAEPANHEVFRVLGGRIDGDELFGGGRRGEQSGYGFCIGELVADRAGHVPQVGELLAGERGAGRADVQADVVA